MIDFAKHRLPDDFGPNHPQWSVPSMRQRYYMAMGVPIGGIDIGRRERVNFVGCPRDYNLINLMVPTYKRSKTKLPKFIDSAVEMSSGKICFSFCVNTSDGQTLGYLKERFKGEKIKHCIIEESLPAPHLAKYFNMIYDKTKFKGEDVLVSMLGDDMVFMTKNYDKIILEEASKTDGKVLIYCNDDYVAKDKLCVNLFTSPQLIRATRKPFMCEHYAMDMIDEVWMAVGRKLNVLEYLDKVIIKHEHSGSVGRDETFIRLNQQREEVYSKNPNLVTECADESALNVLKYWEPYYGDWKPSEGRNICVEKKSQNPLLSVLICHIKCRKRSLKKLLDIFSKQKGNYEILVDGSDNIPTGTKRFDLLKESKGKYVCFVDDDDTVSDDYIEKILDALKTGPDCVGICGVLVENGAKTKPFEHSIKYRIWEEQQEKYVRNPNHLNPIKREIALKVGFPPITVGEDNAFSVKVLPYLKKEEMIESVIYHYIQ